MFKKRMLIIPNLLMSLQRSLKTRLWLVFVLMSFTRSLILIIFLMLFMIWVIFLTSLLIFLLNWRNIW
ncbi:hypothetical protein B5G16_11685 [Alistipes sp. An66]|nr:hypothetical protein B5G16_11685 [Alistipes sp. An66]